MDVIYISYDGMTDSLGQSQVIPYLIGLTKKDHSITIVSSEKKENYKKQKNAIEKLLKEHHISWIPTMYSTLPSIFSKQINLLRIELEVKRLCIIKTPDIIHCRSYMAALIGLKMKKKYHVKFVFDMRGFWADERVDGRLWNLNNGLHKRIYNYFKKKETEFITNADYTISLTQNAKNEILDWPEIENKSPIEVIPCCVDLELFSPDNVKLQKQDLLRNELKITPSDFIISYLGSIGTWYMLDEMLDFFKVLLSRKNNAKFLIITPDNHSPIMIKVKNKGIRPEKIIIHSANRIEVPLFLSLSQLSLYFIKPLYSKKASSPTKTGEIMAMGIPIISNSGIGDSDEILTTSGAGLLVNEFSDKEYDRVIREIDVLLKADTTKIRAAAQYYFSLEKGVELYNDVYKKLKSE